MKTFQKSILLSLIAIALLSSCRKEDEGFKIYRIDKGQHECNGWRMLTSSDNISFVVRFSPECMYNPVEVVPGINKVKGFGSINHYENSARLGWMSSGESIDLYYYCYINGERKDGYITSTMPDHDVYCRIWYAGGYYTFDIDGHLVSVAGAKEVKNCWQLNPYFGGRSTAPCTMTIYIQEL